MRNAKVPRYISMIKEIAKCNCLQRVKSSLLLHNDILSSGMRFFFNLSKQREFTKKSGKILYPDFI